MRVFDPIKDINNSSRVLDKGEWPSFHDAEIHTIDFWRGDIRPEDDSWVGPTLKIKVELCAIQFPYIICLLYTSPSPRDRG